MSLLEAAFPHLTDDGYAVTGPVNPAYNCVAWAAGETHRWWWPDPDGEHYWPPTAPREEAGDAFVAAFACIDYLPAADAALEPGCL